VKNGMKGYKRVIAAAAVALSVSGAAAGEASASTYCPVNGVDFNRSGYEIVYRGAHANGMNCASVRYAMHEFRAEVKRQRGYPRMPRDFFDGWVTWRCWKTGGNGQRCWEATTGTGYTFRAWVF
jgi:hypothetical protein